MFTCKRCAYQTSQKANLQRHLLRQKLCVPIDSDHDVNVKELLDELEPKYNDVAKQCKYCLKKFNNASNMYTHIKRFHKEDKTSDVEQTNSTNNNLEELTRRIMTFLSNASTSQGEYKWEHSPTKSVIHNVVCRALGHAMKHLQTLKDEGQLDPHTEEIIDDWFINAGTNLNNFIKTYLL